MQRLYHRIKIINNKITMNIDLVHANDIYVEKHSVCEIK